MKNNVFKVVLLQALPASGKSEVRNFMAHVEPERLQNEFHIGENLQLDDFPYVHMMRRIDEELAKLDKPRVFYPGEAPFLDGRDWGTLCNLLNEDYHDLMNRNIAKPDSAAKLLFDRFDRAAAGAGIPNRLGVLDENTRNTIAERLEKEARAMLDEKHAGYPESFENKTIIIECARGGPDGAAMPPVDIIQPEQVFDGDVFLFCASRMVPDTSVTGGDVRMSQYGLNRELAAVYARMAREKGYKGLFCVVSDPVDPLCRAVLQESDRGENGKPDGGGLLPCQVRGFGLGVMHARALYFARKDARFASYLTEGRAFGPHGEDLVLANSIEHYDDALSRELTDKVAHANLEMRKLGYKPYVAPALSSGALTLLALLRGQWHYASVYMDGIFMGCRQRLTPSGIEVEHLTLPDALQKRLDTTAARLRAID